MSQGQASGLRVLDVLVSKVRSGDEVTDAELAQAHQAMQDLYAQHKGYFTPDAVTAYYVNAIKLGIGGHPNHSAWAFLSEMRERVYEFLAARAGETLTNWELLAVINPALLKGEVIFAVESYRRLRADLFLAGIAIEWVEEALIHYPSTNNPKACRMFLEELGIRPTA